MIQWYLLHSQYCVTITSIWFQHSLITPKENPKASNLFPSPGHPQALVSTDLLSVSVTLPALDIS